MLERKEYLAKMNNLPKQQGMGPQQAQGSMHWLKAGPDDLYLKSISRASLKQPKSFTRMV